MWLSFIIENEIIALKTQPHNTTQSIDNYRSLKHVQVWHFVGLSYQCCKHKCQLSQDFWENKKGQLLTSYSVVNLGRLGIRYSRVMQYNLLSDADPVNFSHIPWGRLIFILKSSLLPLTTQTLVTQHLQLQNH